MNKIDRSEIDQSMTYAAYQRLIGELLSHNRTTGSNHSAAMLHYTTMNVVRMERLDRTITVTPELAQALKQLQRPMIWLVLTEAWCGDAAQIIPVLARLAEQYQCIDLRLLLRDEHPRLMDAFLTNGSRSIPKLIVLDAGTLEVLATWGPRPSGAQALMNEYKKDAAQITDPEIRRQRYQQLNTDLQKWYARDKTRGTQHELLAMARSVINLSQPANRQPCTS